ncbi:hypothetical protein [Kordia sp.]|uniref:hypothetical protein n=1 Tax=Kordia sp. TaxID=1965332 RepID=UPI003D2D4BF9
MSSIKLSVRSYIAVVSSLLIMFTSCSQYEEVSSENQNFDYSAHEFFTINQQFLTNLTLSKSTSFLNINQEILDNLNEEFETNLSYPELLPDLFGHDMEYILNKSLKLGWINQYNVDLTESFLRDLIDFDFDYALKEFEKNALALNLSTEEFQKLNIFANTVKSINLYHPELFIAENILAKGFWGCAGATLALTAATAGLSSCATIVACAGAIALHLVALNNFGTQCLSDKQVRI